MRRHPPDPSDPAEPAHPAGPAEGALDADAGGKVRVVRLSRVEELVRRALEPGEEVLWMGSPDPWRACWYVVPSVAVIVACLWGAIAQANFLSLILLNSWIQLMPWASQLGVPTALRGAYAVTNRRVLTLHDRRNGRVQTYRFVDPGAVERVRGLFGRLDLVFGTGFMPRQGVQRTGFLCIRDIGGAEAALREMAAETSATPAGRALVDLRGADGAAHARGVAVLAEMGAAGDDVLAMALEDADLEVREAAARAVGLLAKERLPGVLVLSRLSACLDDRYGGASAAAGRSLEAIAATDLAPLVRALCSGDAAAQGCLERILGRVSSGTLAQGTLDALREDDREVAQALCVHLAARPLLRNWVVRDWSQAARTRPESYFPLLQDRPLWGRLWIAQALGMAGATAARRYLAALLQGSDDEETLVAAIGLGFMGDPRAADRLVPALGSDDREVRLSAATALSHVGAAAGSALVPLRKLIGQEQDPHIRDACQTAVNRISFALRRQPTELQAADIPLGRGTEPEASPSTQGTGTELEPAAHPEARVRSR